MKFFGRKKGFTLSEILIALAIIGVVAILVMPSMISQHQKKMYVGQLQKVYNTLSNSLQELIVEENAMDLAGTYLNPNRDYNGVSRFFRENFKLASTCYSYSVSGCIGGSYKQLSGSSAYFPQDAECAVLKTGQTICMRAFSPEWDGQMLDIYVDVNGVKGPNMFGRDAYILKGYRDGSVGEVANGASYFDPSRCNSSHSSYAEGCFTRIMTKGWDMDY